MLVRQALRRGRWLLPLCVLGLVTTASSQQYADPESFTPGQDQVEGDLIETPGEGEDGETRTYVVQEGDTLWDISDRLLGSPWYWPQVWSFNPEIANPHWIYPGNVIRFMAPSAVGPTQLIDPADGIVATDVGMADQVVTATGELTYRIPQTIGVVDQGFISAEEIDGVGEIVASFEEKMLLTRFDRVYVELPDPRIGQRYVAFRTGREVLHPTSGEMYGYQTEVVGELRVVELHPDGLATAVIGDTLDAVQRGDRLLPWTDPFTRDVLRRENMVEVEGIIISALVPRSRVFGQNQYVFIDRGRADGVQEGNTFAVTRRGDPLAAYIAVDPELELPWEDVGMVLVTETRDETSVGLVLRSIREIEPGERVVMRVDDGRQHAQR